jgi:murein DD-endopeptidase MepM/ murein hydrolase activator NlpD
LKKRFVLCLLLIFCLAIPVCSANTSWKVLQPFGWNTDPDGLAWFNNGINLIMPIGTPISAPLPGTVIAMETDPDGYGYYIVLDHGDGKQTIYGHILQSSFSLHKLGDAFNKGDTIAFSGNEGNSSTPHLHVGYSETNDPYKSGCIDPMPLLIGAGWDIQNEKEKTAAPSN